MAKGAKKMAVTTAEKSAVAVAKVFMTGRSQAVRIPKAFRFEGDEVEIRKTKRGVLLTPKINAKKWQWLLDLRKEIDEDMIKSLEYAYEHRNDGAELDDKIEDLGLDFSAGSEG